MTRLKKFSWEVTHVSTVMGVITTLAIVIHLTGAPRVGIGSAANRTAFAPPVTGPAALAAGTSSQHRPASLAQANPSVIVVGPPEISNRYTLLRVDRRPISRVTDEVTVRLHVESLATDPLVSPFESHMLELVDQQWEMFSPNVPFSHPVQGGSSLDQNVVFHISRGMSLNGASLRIQYDNYQASIPLNLTSRDSVR